MKRTCLDKHDQAKPDRLCRIRAAIGICTRIKTSFLPIIISLLLFSVTGCGEDEKTLDYVDPDEPDSTTEETPVQYGTPFDQVPAASGIAMYEVNPLVFSSSGNLAGVEERLNDIKALGINVLWLMPVYPVGELNSVGSPYCVRNYEEVNPDYGTLDDLRELVEEAHSRDMAVILDWVANHTSWDNEWIVNKSWYTQDASGNIISPAGTEWTDVADLNYSSTGMRSAMIKAMKYWILTVNVDGYRCDYAEGVPADFWKQAIDTLRNIPGREIIMLAEASDKDLYSSGFNLIYGWDYYSKLKEVFTEDAAAGILTTANAGDYADLPSGSEVLRFTTNHDYDYEETPLTVFGGKDRSLAAFVVASCMGGVPLIYNGQEVGCPDKLSYFSGATTKIDWTINPEMLEKYQKLMTFRNRSDAIKTGSIESFSVQDVVAFKRTSGDEEVLVIVNVRNIAVDFQLPASLANTNWENVIDGTPVSLQNELTLDPYAWIILKN